MKKILITITLIIANQAFSQKALFDTLRINSSTKIIGRYPQYDANKTYEKYNFIIEDSASIAQFIKNIKLGKEVKNSFEKPNFKLTVVKNFNEIGSWTINPNQKSAMTHDGHTYAFDLTQLEKLNEKHAFTYLYHIKNFATKAEYDDYLKQQKNNPSFLFDYPPQFKYEGSFEIQFKKSEQFPSPKVISDYLSAHIEKIVPKDEYELGYILDEYNMNNPDQYTMTITGPKKLFEELNLKTQKSKKWQPTIEEGYFFYKK